MSNKANKFPLDLLTGLYEAFDKDANIVDDHKLKMNVKEIGTSQLTMLNHLVDKHNLGIHIKRSGTGMLILIEDSSC